MQNDEAGKKTSKLNMKSSLLLIIISLLLKLNLVRFVP